MDLNSANHKEIAHTLKPASNLVGIAHVPSCAQPGNPVVVFVSAGLLHRAGPYGFYTQAARNLAKIGFHVLRFDLSGIGDSENHNLDTEQMKQAHEDVTSAIDFVCAEYQCDTVVLAGLCSGADDSLNAAIVDTRIRGILMIDGPGFRTPRFKVNRILHHYRHRIFNKKKWASLLEIVKSKTTSNGKIASQNIDSEDRPLMNTENLVPLVDALAARSVKMHFIYTGGVYQYYNYAGQVFDMFSKIKCRHVVTESFHSDSDHLFMLREHRQMILEDMLAWVQHSFGSQDFSQTNINDNSQSIDENKLIDGDSEVSSKAA